MKRVRNLYDPTSESLYRLSRSKIDLFIQCPRCFYLDRRLGVGQPPSFPFNLNSAVDALLKKEFDQHRVAQTPHPYLVEAKIDAVPFAHEKIDEWRDSLRRGITARFGETNLLITGGIDDIWVNPVGELHIVDYKATAKQGEVSLDAAWQAGYRRQVEIYQWLFRQNGFRVSPTAYFVYCNGNLDASGFSGRLEFKVKILPHVGEDSWVPPALERLHRCLNANTIPKANPNCVYCSYRAAAQAVES